jgi:uncharacterized protein involved in exopolysaccharide biosynthesis
VRQGASAPLLADYAGFVRRHRWWLAGLVVAGIAVGAVLATRAPATWTATASVALTPVPKYVTDTSSRLEPPAVTIDTDAQLLRSPEVVAAVAGTLGVDPRTAVGRVTVTASPLSRVLHVSVTASSPARAAAAADAAVTALGVARRDTLGALRDDQVNQVRALVDRTESELARQQASRVVVPATDDLFATLVEQRQTLDELEEARREPVRVVAVARPPHRPDPADPEVPLVSGAALGLLLACAVGAVRDRWPLTVAVPSPGGTPCPSHP